MIFLEHIWLIPLFPALGAATMFFFGRRLQKATVSAVCVGSVVLAFLMACGAVLQYTSWAPAHEHQPFEKVRQPRSKQMRDFCSIHCRASGCCL
jgi:NADH:ubiquinone oxidoreductase subunit 5 (subunit L)/multisubunit Na+/H+ antiporter MnhA subunit